MKIIASVNPIHSLSFVAIWQIEKNDSKEVALFKDLLIYNTSFYVDHIAF